MSEALSPNSIISHYQIVSKLGEGGIAQLNEAKGMHDAAIEQCRKAIDLVGRTSLVLSLLGHAYAESGRRDEAIKIINELNEPARNEYISPYDIAIIYVGLRDKEQAFEQLAKAYDDRA